MSEFWRWLLDDGGRVFGFMVVLLTGAYCITSIIHAAMGCPQ